MISRPTGFHVEIELRDERINQEVQKHLYLFPKINLSSKEGRVKLALARLYWEQLESETDLTRLEQNMQKIERWLDESNL